MGDRQQALGDREQGRIDRLDEEHQASVSGSRPLSRRDQRRIEHVRSDIARAQARRRLDQEQLDRAQDGRDERQHLLEEQQAVLDDPALNPPQLTEEERAEEARRRTEAAVNRADATARRAEHALERAEEARLRLASLTGEGEAKEPTGP